MVVPCRTAPSIIAATSEAAQLISWEWTAIDFFSMCQYRTLAAIGTQLGIGRPTVKTHVENIYKKLGASTRAEAVELAETGGLLPRA